MYKHFIYFLIGCPRTGSTFLYNILKTKKGINLLPKENHFFLSPNIFRKKNYYDTPKYQLKTSIDYYLKKLILIDDQRELAKFSHAARILKIKTMVYMHGKISKNTKFLKKMFFSYYLVWSNFFANQLLKSNPNIKKSKILVVGNPNLRKLGYKPKKKIYKIKKCLILDEDFITFDQIKNYLDVIKLKKASIKFYLKKKKTRDLPNNIKNFCKQNQIYIITKDIHLGNLVSKYKIDSIIASTSSGLLEALFYEIIPIKIKSFDKIRENEFKPFIDNNLIYDAYDRKSFEKILNFNFNKKDIKKRKIKVWGNI